MSAPRRRGAIPKATAAEKERGLELIMSLRCMPALLQRLLQLKSLWLVAPLLTVSQVKKEGREYTKRHVESLLPMFDGFYEIADAFQKLHFKRQDVALIDRFSRYSRAETGWTGPIVINGVYVSPPLDESDMYDRRQCSIPMRGPQVPAAPPPPPPPPPSPPLQSPARAAAGPSGPARGFGRPPRAPRGPPRARA